MVQCRLVSSHRGRVPWGLLALLTLVPAGPACSEVLLHAAFDGDLKATTVGGEVVGKFEPPRDRPDAQPVFAEGVLGKALDIGTGCRVFFSTEGTLRNERGSISFWARRAGPRPEGRYTFHLGGWSNADGSWVLLYRWEWYTGVHMLHGRGGAGDIGLEVPGDGDDGNWHFFVFTWDGTHARGYLDGQTTSSADQMEFPAPQFAEFWVGGGDATSRLIDELRFHDEALSISEVKSLYREVAGVTTTPTLVLPRRTAPIVVDGQISEEEWSRSVQTTGFVGIESKVFASTQTTVRGLYDDEAIYLALDSALPERVKQDLAMTAGMTGVLRQTQDRFDTSVDHDDALEVNVMPRWPADAPTAEGTWYRLVVNGLNTHYDYAISDQNVISLDWNPEWQSASTVDGEGWHAEIRLPYAAFDAAPPSAGEQWGLNFIRIWQALQSGREAWCVGPAGTPGYRYAVAPVRFGDTTVPVVQLADWGPVQDNRLAVRGQVINLADTPLALRAAVGSDSGEVELTQELQVPPGGAAPLRFDARIQEPATSLLTLEVTDGEGKVVWLRSQVPVLVRDVLEITSAHFPSAGIFKVMADAGRLRDTPLAQLALSVTMQDQQGTPVLPPRTLSPMPGYTCGVELDVSSLPPGRYQARCEIRAGEQQVTERLIAYEKQPPPEWLGNSIGITDRVPGPFSPLVRGGETIACWGREYRYDGRLFPSQIISQGGELLAGPVELVLYDMSGASWSSVAAPTQGTWGRATDFRVEFDRSCRLGAVPVTVSSWIECDGFLWNTIRIPACGETVARLVVRVPLNKSWSEYINPYDYSTVNTGKLKRDGWSGGGQPLWLGNGTGGFQFTCETLAPCRLREGTKPLRVVCAEDANVLELTLIDTPTRLDEPFSVSWGWVATPTRPPTPGYRGWATGNCSMSPGYMWYWPPGTEFDPRWLGYSHFISETERPDGQGKRLISGGPYVVTSSCPVSVPEYAYWGDEWSPSRTGRRADGGIGQCSVAAQSWTDFFVWCYRRLYDRGRFVGLYYDCAPYLPDDNIYHGGGVRVDDRILPTNPVLAARRIAQRLYCMLRELEPEQTMVLYHNSGQIDMAFLSWCDVFVDGENFTSRLSKTEQDYHRIYPPEAFLAQSMGHNFGPTCYFLDEFNRSGATTEADWDRLGVQPVTHLYGLILLHDSTYWKAYGIQKGYEMVDAALAKYSFDERYQMIPYWSQQVVALPEKVYATFYRDPQAQRVLMVLLNNNEEDLLLRLKLDWQALGFDDPTGLQVDDAVFGEGARIEGGELVTPVGRANMRLLAISR